ECVLNEGGPVQRPRASTLITCRNGKWVRVFMLIPVFGPSSDSLPSRFGQGVGVPLGLRRVVEAARGETTMAKVLDGIDRGHESAHLILSPSVRPCPLALADRDRRAQLEPRDLTAWFFGDPLPGMSALDRRIPNERAH